MESFGKDPGTTCQPKGWTGEVLENPEDSVPAKGMK